MHNKIDPADAPGPGVSPAPASIDPQLLERFSRLMASRDWPVEPPRMQRGSPYAYKRLALAYSSGDAALRALSLTLYEGYQAQSVTKTARRVRAGSVEALR
jgi:hypothetical protein